MKLLGNSVHFLVFGRCDVLTVHLLHRVIGQAFLTGNRSLQCLREPGVDPGHMLVPKCKSQRVECGVMLRHEANDGAQYFCAFLFVFRVIHQWPFTALQKFQLADRDDTGCLTAMEFATALNAGFCLQSKKNAAK